VWLEITIVPTTPSTDQAQQHWLEGTTVVSFSFPLGRIYGTEECKVTMMSQPTTHNSSSNNNSNGSNSNGSGSGSSGVGQGSEPVVVQLTVRDVIASPQTSGCPLDYDSEATYTTNNTNSLNNTTNSSNISSGNYNPSSTNSDGTNRTTTQRCRWLPTYTGTTFALRHSLTVTLKRPWYAWSPEHTAPLSLYRLSQPLVGGVDGNRPRICGRFDDEEDEEENNVLPLTVRVRVGGVCGMTVPSRWVDVDAPLLGKVSEIVLYVWVGGIV
jgi:hypothetical protein